MFPSADFYSVWPPDRSVWLYHTGWKLSRRIFNCPSDSTTSQNFCQAFSSISENFSVCKFRLLLRSVAHFGAFVKYKSSSSKNFFVKPFLRCKCENFFENFSEIFVPTGPGRFCQVLFLRSSSKKNISPYIIPHFGAFVKRFLRKTFFIFREKLLDFTPHIYYNIYVR